MILNQNVSVFFVVLRALRNQTELRAVKVLAWRLSALRLRRKSPCTSLARENIRSTAAEEA